MSDIKEKSEKVFKMNKEELKLELELTWENLILGNFYF